MSDPGRANPPEAERPRATAGEPGDPARAGASARGPFGADGPRRILIVRLSSLGDVVHTLPVLHALRQSFPRAEIGWAVDDRSSALLEGHPELTHVHVMPRRQLGRLRWWKQWRALKRFTQELRSFAYEVAVDVQSLTKSGYLAWSTGARVRIGYSRPEGREISGWFHTVRISPGPGVVHVTERHLSLLRPLGVRRAQPTFVFPDFAAERRRLEPFLKECGAGPAVLQPGANWANKRWPVGHHAALARRIVAELSLPDVVAAHGDLERSWAETIAREAGAGVRVAPPMDVRELCALLEAAAVVVGGDTGPVHIAWALGRPTVAVFGPTTGQRNGPLGPRTRWIDSGLGCVGCWHRSCPDRTDACMRRVEPDAVFELVREVLAPC